MYLVGDKKFLPQYVLVIILLSSKHVSDDVTLMIAICCAQPLWQAQVEDDYCSWVYTGKDVTFKIEDLFRLTTEFCQCIPYSQIILLFLLSMGVLFVMQVFCYLVLMTSTCTPPTKGKKPHFMYNAPASSCLIK